MRTKKCLPDFRSWLQPSQRVIKDSKKYVETYLEGKQYVGVQLRTVKLTIALVFTTKYLKTVQPWNLLKTI